jgi:hypothetical protein
MRHADSIEIPARSRLARGCAGVVVWILMAGPASADSCVFEFEARAKSPDGHFKFEVVYDQQAHTWKGRWENTRTGEVNEKALAGPGWHVHPHAFISVDGSRVVLFNTGGGTDPRNLVLVYDRRLELLRGFGLDDLLTPEERGRVTTSISHINFMGGPPDRNGPSYGLEPGGEVFMFHAPGGRKVRVALAKPEIPAEKPKGP